MAQKTVSKAAASKTAETEKNKPSPVPTVEETSTAVTEIVKEGTTNDTAPDGKPNIEFAATPKNGTVRTVELADKDTGFWDAETEFQIVRDQKKELTEPIGTATQRALQSGRLLVIGEK